MKELKKYTNRLAQEKSPYLLQHAHNPVDWYPWGEEAFQKAKTENKLIFLSIGYSTCHWCHVMEHESFEDETIAQFLNKHYVAIKVDREERPDIDSVYMTSVMAMTSQGGWPLSVFLTPDKRPFFGGTYFPPYPKWGSPGFLDVLQSIQQSWETNQSQVITSSVTLTEIIKQRKEEADAGGSLTENALHAGYDQFAQMFDQTFGGFGQQPKFPSSHNLSFLLRYYRKTKESFALNIVEKTLTKMAQGGLQDQLGGGFHRYSTDQEWQIPHFEKMLYDQALLARTYCEAYQVTKNEFYADVARGIFEYVLRDMCHSEGGFFSAEDADSYDPDEYKSGHEESLHKKEGAFFLWRHDELAQILTEKEFKVFIEYYGVEKNGNAKSDPHGEFTGKNVLYVAKDLEEIARSHQLSLSEIKVIIQQAKLKLLQVRSQRPRPHLDDKVLTDWNGLMIASLAYGARVLQDQILLKAAEKADHFILQKLIKPNGQLHHRFRDGQSAIEGTLDDYAFYVQALLELYETTFEVRYLKRAVDLALKMIDLFWDDKKGGFFQTSHEAEELIFRLKEIYDGAIPSGNSMACTNFIRLYHMTFNPEFKDSAEGILNIFAQDVMSNPGSYAQLLSAFLLVLNGMKEVVIVEGKNMEFVDEVLHFASLNFLPEAVFIKKPMNDKDSGEILKIAPALNQKMLINEKTTVYICEHHECQKPLTEIEELKKAFIND